MRVGDRVRLHENGANAPTWLLGEVGTVTKVNRSRVVVQFDAESMSRAINKKNLRPASWKPSDGWDGMSNVNPDALIAEAERLARWEAWEGEFTDNGCADADDTIRAYWKRGFLHALAAVAQGYDLSALAAEALADTESMILGDPEEEEADPHVCFIDDTTCADCCAPGHEEVTA